MFFFQILRIKFSNYETVLKITIQSHVFSDVVRIVIEEC